MDPFPWLGMEFSRRSRSGLRIHMILWDLQLPSGDSQENLGIPQQTGTLLPQKIPRFFSRPGMLKPNSNQPLQAGLQKFHNFLGNEAKREGKSPPKIGNVGWAAPRAGRESLEQTLWNSRLFPPKIFRALGRAAKPQENPSQENLWKTETFGIVFPAQHNSAFSSCPEDFSLFFPFLFLFFFCSPPPFLFPSSDWECSGAQGFFFFSIQTIPEFPDFPGFWSLSQPTHPENQESAFQNSQQGKKFLNSHWLCLESSWDIPAFPFPYFFSG